MYNYKLTIQYAGTNYAGWQIQENAVTVQQTIRDAIQTVLREEINLIGAGRTDSGVHAFGQVANFRSNNKLDFVRFRYAVNSILPNDIAIISMEEVDVVFHARFDAKKRSYFYFITRQKSPFYFDYTHYIYRDFNTIILNKISEPLLGKHDFTSFCRKNTETENKICNVYSLNWKLSKDILIFYIEADRFLHTMVRSIVGTILNAEKENLNENNIKEILESKNREIAFEAVPSKGLFLNKVKYLEKVK